MFTLKSLTVVVFLCLIVPVLHAATIHVPSDQPTIQAGIDEIDVAASSCIGDLNIVEES
jgi:hypothetical protein